jgi:glyoxylase-like metal-dependent hydrolase (beta-lactamase superfamily II)
MSPQPEPIDVLHLDQPQVICCWRIGDALVDPGPASSVHHLLAALDGWVPSRLLLTHIHFDHAGASGVLTREWPDVEVFVHERGAPHLADPTKLVNSATRIYGDDMDRLWGEIAAVPGERLHALAGGETLDAGIEVAYTPGHAKHHVTYYDPESGTAFVGDVGGVRMPGSAYTVPPTPPPDIDVPAWHESLDRVAAWSPARLALTHFGSVDDVEDQIARMHARLDERARLAEELEFEAFTAAVQAEAEHELKGEAVVSMLQAAPPETLHGGLSRWLSKRDEQD